ncbi:MAG: hypothetical protein ACJ798_02020 [Phenylobacterium sp.]
MFAARLAQPARLAPATLPLRGWLRQAWSFWWAALKDHVADRHFIPRLERRGRTGDNL